MGDVTKLKAQPDLPDYEQIGVDVQFIQAIGEGRQLVVKTSFAQATPLAVQKKFVRDMLSIADAEKAHYELVELQTQLLVKTKALKRAEEDVARIAERHGKRRAEIAEEMKKLQHDQGQRAEAFANAFRASGRQGQFEPKGAQKAELARFDQDIGKLASEMQKIDQTEATERRDVETALAREKQDIGVLHEEIAKRRMILGLAEEEAG